jgi:hypothetical protein
MTKIELRRARGIRTDRLEVSAVEDVKEVGYALRTGRRAGGIEPPAKGDRSKKKEVVRGLFQGRHPSKYFDIPFAVPEGRW